MLIQLLAQSSTFAPAVVVLVALAAIYVIARKWTGSSWRLKALIGGGVAALTFVVIVASGLNLALVMDRYDMPSWVPDSALIKMEGYARWAVSLIDIS